ncbi:MAG: ABC transporter substrate-binding protein, partial [Clostridia bacterium]|nr:ABC transporter substrate-binding protein [Clostridia bacterium]
MKISGRFFALVLSVLLVSVSCFALTSCDGGNTAKADFTVGICQIVPHQALDEATRGFKDALSDEMKKKGKTVAFDEQNAQNDMSICSTALTDFVTTTVDLILANATPVLQTASNATTTIPILGTSVTEYGVALDIKDFKGTVGGNISGTSDLAPLDEQAQMILDLIPSAKKIGILYCNAEANSKYQADKVKEYLEKEGEGITVSVATFSDSNDITTVLNGIVDNLDALYIPTDNTAASCAQTIDNICRPKKLPIIAGEENICKVCGIATLSISYYNLGRKTGEMASRILLEGADISKMAIEYDTEYVKKYN